MLVIGCGLPILGRAMGHFLGEFGKGQFSGEVCICELLAATMDSAWDGCALSGASGGGSHVFRVTSGCFYTHPAPGVII